MMFNLDHSLRTARLQLLADAINGGSLTLYTAPKPAIGAAITTQTALVVVDVPTGLTVVDVLLSIALTAPTVLVDGEAAWGRFTSSSAAFVADGDCGLVGASVAFQLKSTFLSAGASLIPILAQLTEP